MNDNEVVDLGEIMRKSGKKLALCFLIVLVVVFSALFVTACNNNDGSGKVDPPEKTYKITVVDGHIQQGNTQLKSADYVLGTSVTVVADVPSGKTFDRWVITQSGKDNVTVYDSTYTFNVSAAVTFRAYFKADTPVDPDPEKFTLTIVGGKTVTGGLTSTTVNKNTQVTIIAVVPDGKEFDNWTIAGAEYATTQQITVTVDKNITITANFKNQSTDPEEPQQCTLTITNGKTLVGSTSVTVDKGTSVTIVADFIDGKIFRVWKINGQEQPARNTRETVITVYSNTTAEAMYTDVQVEQFTVAVINGTVNGEGSVTVPAGTSVTVTAVEEQNRIFKEWLLPGGDIFGTEKTFTYVVEKDITFRAAFEKAFTLTVNGGTVLGGDTVFKENTEVTVIPDASTATSVFSEWRFEYNIFASSGDASNGYSYTFILDRDTEITAYFIKKSADDTKINVKVIGGQIYETNAYTHSKGTEISHIIGTALYVKADMPSESGIGFLGWYYSYDDNGTTKNVRLSSVGTAQQFSYFGFYDDILIFAVFSREYSLSVSDGYINGNPALSSGSFAQYGEVTVTAKSYEDRLFTGWFINNQFISSGSGSDSTETYTFKLNEDTVVEAVYKYYYYVNATDAKIDGAAVTSKKVLENTEVTLTVVTPENKVFAGAWVIDGKEVQGGETLKLKITGTTTASPKFHNLYTITVVNGTIAYGDETGLTEVKVLEGTKLTLTPDTIEGKRFDAWCEGDKTVWSLQEYSITVGKVNRTITVKYINLYSVSLTNGVITHVDGEEYDGSTVIFDEGTSITISPNDRTAEMYSFNLWRINGTDTSANGDDGAHTFVLTANTTVLARYVDIFTLTVRNSDGADGDDVVTQHVSSTTATATATVPSGKSFKRWVNDKGEEASKSNPYSFTIKANTVLIAEYDNTFKFTVINGKVIKINGVTCTPSTEVNVIDGQSVTIEKDELANREFEGWYDNNNVRRSGAAIYNVNNIRADMTYTARYVRTVTINVTGGLVGITGVSSTEAPSGVFAVGNDVSVRLTQTPEIGSEFKQWNISGQNGMTTVNNATFSFNVDPADESVTTIDIRVVWHMFGERDLTIINADGLGINKETRGVVFGRTTQLTATIPNSQMNFEGWYKNDESEPLSKDTQYLYTMSEDADTVIEAKFSMMYTQTRIGGRQWSGTNKTAYATYFNNGNDAFTFPGLKAGENVVIQGMDYSSELDWMFVCGYVSPVSNVFSTNSVIFVIDMKQTDAASNNPGKLIKEIILQTTSGGAYTGHAGGVCVTKNNLFISNDANLYRIPLKTIENAKATAFVKFVESIPVPVNSSYCTFDEQENVLWVGEFEYNSGGTGKTYPTASTHRDTTGTTGTYRAWTVGYKLNETGLDSSYSNNNGFRLSALGGSEGATPDYVYWHGAKIQGFAIAGNKVVLSESYGRTNDSHLYIFPHKANIANASTYTTTVSINGQSVPVWKTANTSGITVTAATMSEDLAPYYDKSTGQWYVYVGCESASNLYYNGTDGSGNSTYQSDMAWRYRVSQT